MSARSTSEINPRSLLVVLTVTIATALSGSQFASISISVFLAQITSDYGWTRAQISGAVTMMYIGIAAGSPLFGIAADRFGARSIILPLTLLSGLFIGLFAAAGASLWLFYAAHLLLGLSQPGMVAYSKLISTWFTRRRAFALSAIALGVLTSQIAVPPLARLLLERVGWHHAYLLFGAAEIVIALPLLLLFFHERRTSVDDDANRAPAAPIADEEAEPAFTIFEAMRKPIYWHLLAGQACIAYCFLSVAIHAVGILSERGVEPTTAVWGLSTFAVGGMVAKLIVGYLLDRFDTPQVMAPFALLALASLLLLQFGRGEIVSLSAMFFFGFGCTACGPMAYLMTRYFGLRSFSAVFGSTVPILILLGSGSPLLSGLIYDSTGSYAWALAIANLAMFAGFLTFLFLPSYPKVARG
jgi:predicted MFS family arabinose efflux permease